MKRTILAITVIAMLVSMFVFPTSAAELPAPYADLAFNADGTLYDAAGNAEITLVSVNGNAKVGPMEVTLDDGQIHNTWAVRLTEAYEIIEFYYPQFASEADYEAFVRNGFTLEIYAAYDNHLEKTAGIFGSNKGRAGASILFRGRYAGQYDHSPEASHQIMFQVGVEEDEAAKQSILDAGGWTNGKYVYCGNSDLGSQNVTDTELLDEHLGKLVHLLATYDPVKKELRLYFNGVHVQTGPMGNALLNADGADYTIMTVGHNASYPAESTVEKTPMTVSEARVYNCALSDEQAFAAYTKCRENVINGGNAPAGAGADTPATEAPATEAPATEAPVTEAPATEAPATDAPATEAPTVDATEAPATEAPATDAPTTEAPKAEGGCGGVIGIGAIVAILGAAVVLKKKD